MPHQSNDGRVVYDVELFQVKTPQALKAAYDIYKPVRRIAATTAFPPM